jgi:hypothetical protein
VVETGTGGKEGPYYEASRRDITLGEGRNSPRSVGLSSLSSKLRSKRQKQALMQNREMPSFREARSLRSKAEENHQSEDHDVVVEFITCQY